MKNRNLVVPERGRFELSRAADEKLAITSRPSWNGDVQAIVSSVSPEAQLKVGVPAGAGATENAPAVSVRFIALLNPNFSVVGGTERMLSGSGSSMETVGPDAAEVRKVNLTGLPRVRPSVSAAEAPISIV